MKRNKRVILQLLIAVTASSALYLIGSPNNPGGDASLVGVFSSDADYFDSLDVLMANAKEEVKHCQEYTLDWILPQVEGRGHFTDVGPGDGQLTKLVGSHFKEVTIIDKSPLALEKIDIDDFSPGLKVSKVNESIESCDLNEVKSDLILYSHLLYYVDRSEWVNIAKKGYAGLNPGGVLAIIFCESLDRSKLHKHFGATYPDSSSFIEKCKKEFSDAKVEVYSSVAPMIVDNVDDMVKLVGIYLNDVNQAASKENVIEYLNNNLRNEDGVYKMNTQQYFLVIKKNSGVL